MISAGGCKQGAKYRNINDAKDASLKIHDLVVGDAFGTFK